MVSLSLQIVLISSGVLSLALLLKVSVPFIGDFSVYQAPLLWSSLSSWLKPPYLYVIVNCIIITIVASSRFHYRRADDKDQQEHVPAPKVTVHEPDFRDEMKVSAAEIRPCYGDPETESTEPEVVYELKEAEEVSADEAVYEDKSTVVVNAAEVEDEKDEDEFLISRSSWIPTKRTNSSENLSELLLLPAEKHLFSAHIGHRKPVKASPEGGRGLRVAKPKRHETLENTWKMITEAQAMPLTRHLKKSDTFDYSRQVDGNDVDPFLPKKSETFKERTNYPQPPLHDDSTASAKLRKEQSPSQDELNRRVEAFIKKFNDDMRMQRQESLNQYKEMINRGSH